LDSISIDCQANNCALILSDGQELLSFNFNDLDKLEYELLRLKIGVYDREVRTKKNVR